MLMLRRISRLTTETFWVALGHVAAVTAAIAAVAFLTRALGPEAYGQYALATTVVLLVPQFVFTPIGNAGMRFFSVADEAGALTPFLRGLRRLAFAGFFVAATLVLGFVALLRWADTTVTPTLAVTAGVFGLTAGVTSLLSLLQTAARRRVVVAIHDGLAPWIRLLLAILILRLAPAWSATGAMLGYGLRCYGPGTCPSPIDMRASRSIAWFGLFDHHPQFSYFFSGAQSCRQVVFSYRNLPRCWYVYCQPIVHLPL